MVFGVDLIPMRISVFLILLLEKCLAKFPIWELQKLSELYMLQRMRGVDGAKRLPVNAEPLCVDGMT